MGLNSNNIINAGNEYCLKLNVLFVLYNCCSRHCFLRSSIVVIPETWSGIRQRKLSRYNIELH